MIQTTIKKLEKSEVEITGVLPAASFEAYEDKALAVIGQRLELAGFRKGKAPASVIREHASEMMILEEMAEQALSASYASIIEDNKIDAIGRPQISITKIAKGADLEFKIVTAVLPEMKLPHYKELSKKHATNDDFKKEIPVDEAQVEKTILDLRKMRAHQAMPAHEHQDNDAAHPELSEEELPVFDDAFVKSFGEFADTEAFKNKIRENLKKEKETEQKDKLRLAIVEDLVSGTEGEIPEILIESETDKILYRLQADITNMGFKFDEYLIQVGKTEEELRNEWRADALKRAKLQMIIHTIADKESIKPTEEELEKEVQNILTAYKDADPIRARAYVENMLENEKVFQFLENQ
jgi:FKBP-type peptidyl-prolyl cis-trans isomerase (trigger factor)